MAQAGASVPAVYRRNLLRLGRALTGQALIRAGLCWCGDGPVDLPAGAAVDGKYPRARGGGDCYAQRLTRDLQDLNQLLFQQYPGRRFFVYEYDEKKQPILREIVPNEVFEAGDWWP